LPRRAPLVLALALALVAALGAGCGLGGVDFEVYAPEDGEVTSFSRTMVRGHVPIGSFSVKVNGKTVRPNVNGDFAVNVPLEVGKNEIKISVGDAFHRSTKTLTVRRIRSIGG